MRADVLEQSLRGRRERRLRGLVGLRSFTDPMLPGAGTVRGTTTSADRSFAVASSATAGRAMTLDASSRPMLTLAIPAMVRPLGPDTSGMTVVGAPAPPAGAMPGTRFDRGPGGTSAPPSRSPVEVPPEEVVDDVTGDADVSVTVDEPPAIVPRTATPSFWARYKWWILGLVVATMGAGGIWMVRRASRR